MQPVEDFSNVQWQPVGVPAPFDVDIELAVLDREGAHALVFPCRRIVRADGSTQRQKSGSI